MSHKEETTEGTERRFRPFLDRIPFPHPPAEPLIFNGMINECYPFLGNIKLQVYVIKRDLEDDRLGYGTLTHWDENRYVFTIYLSPSLFPGGQLDSPKLRKVVGVHEFVHCTTAVMNISKTKSEPERKDFRNKLHNKLSLEIISAQDIEKITRQKGAEHIMHSTAGSRFYPDNINFDDAHYRLEDDFSTIKYNELNDQLLLSRADFERYIGNNLPTFKASVKKNAMGAYKQVLRQYKNMIANEMDLYEDFVVRRIAEILNIYLWE